MSFVEYPSTKTATKMAIPCMFSFVVTITSLAMSTSGLEALPGKLDIKRHSPSILYLLILSESLDDLSVSETTEDADAPCVWCQKIGRDQYTIKTSNGTKTFCSEVCFIQCRRASFKQSKICDWCKHVRHTVNYVEFRDGESQLQFCSEKCLNQYKMSIFCKETQEHLNKIKENGEDSEPERDNDKEKEILITPDLWMISDHMAKVRKANQSTEGTVSDRSDSHRKSLTNSIEKSLKKMAESNQSNELTKQSLIERIKAEANVKRRVPRKENDRHVAASATEPATSPRPGSLAQVSPQMYHPALAGMAPWIHQAQLLGSMGQAFGPYGAYSSVMFPGLVPPYPPELMAEIPSTPERGKEQPISSRDKRIKIETSTSGAHTERSSSNNTRRSSHLEVPSSESARPSTSPNRTIHHTNTRQSSSLFPVDFPQMFPGQNFPGPIPAGILSQSQRPIGSGIPPVTMMMPFPVLLPLPVPIPIPLPLTMDTILKHFQPKSAQTSDTKQKTAIPNREYRDILQDSKSPRPSPAGHSPLSTTSSEDIRNYGNANRSGSRSSCPDLSSSYHYVSPSLSDTSSLKRSRTPDEVGTLDLSKRSRVPKFDHFSYEETDGVIDLSSKYHRRSPLEHRSENTSSNEDINDTDDISSVRDSNDNLTESEELVPKIHIVTHAETRPLSQQLPLPSTEQRYAKRRALILDAPTVPKKKRSPSPERPNYVRNIPRDLIEAARRRSLRARIRTK